MKWLLLLIAVPFMVEGPIIGMLSSPWSPFWFSGKATLAGEPEGPLPAVADPGDIIAAHGFVSDVQRYQLAVAAGWTREEAVLATAISIAEDGTGDPAALSGVNHNGSRDLGLWQINSGWWPQFGGSQALVDPFANARAGRVIYGRQGWCAWSTYAPCPVAGHSAAYLAFMARARLAANTLPPPNLA